LSLIQTGKVGLYCRIAGEGQSCVLLHGSFIDGSFWKEQIAALSQKFRVIVPDLRGHGLSGKPLDGYTHEHMAQDIRNLLRTFGIKRACLVGHSMGSRIAIQFALDYPKTVEKLVLANGGAGPIINRQTVFPENVQKEIGFGTPHFDQRKFNYYEIWYSFAHPSTEHVNKILEQTLKTPDYVKAGVAKNFPKKDLRPRLPQIQAPTLVITGEKDVICPIEEARYLAQHIPKARLEIIPDSGHCLPIEKPKEFNTTIISFLKKD